MATQSGDLSIERLHLSTADDLVPPEIGPSNGEESGNILLHASLWAAGAVVGAIALTETVTHSMPNIIKVPVAIVTAGTVVLSGVAAVATGFRHRFETNWRPWAGPEPELTREPLVPGLG